MPSAGYVQALSIGTARRGGIVAQHSPAVSTRACSLGHLDLTAVGDEELGQLALKNARPADRDDQLWALLCADDTAPRVVSVLLAMKSRNTAALAARQFPGRTDPDRRLAVQAHRQWRSRAEKFGHRVDAALAAMHAGQSRARSMGVDQPRPQ